MPKAVGGSWQLAIEAARQLLLQVVHCPSFTKTIILTNNSVQIIDTLTIDYGMLCILIITNYN